MKIALGLLTVLAGCGSQSQELVCTNVTAEMPKQGFSDIEQLPASSAEHFKDLIEKRSPKNPPLYKEETRAEYENAVTSHFSPYTVTSTDETCLRMIYPAGYFRNVNPAAVLMKKTIIQLKTKNDIRIIGVYETNFKNETIPTLAINGHFGEYPSQYALGLRTKGALSDPFAAKLSISGMRLILYDDTLDFTFPNKLLEGDSWTSNPSPDRPLIHTIENLKIVQDVILSSFDSIDLVGLSGGAERGYHFLMFGEIPIRRAYLAGYFTQPWATMDALTKADSPFGFDHDTADFNLRFQLHDILNASSVESISLVVASGEGGLSKAFLKYDIMPNLSRSVEIRGDDKDLDGVPEDGEVSPHGYQLEDVLSWSQS